MFVCGQCFNFPPHFSFFFFFSLNSKNSAFSFSLNNHSCCWDNSLLRPFFLLRGNIDCTYKYALPRVYNSNSNITWTIVSATCSKNIQTKAGLPAFSEMLWRCWQCHHGFIFYPHNHISENLPPLSLLSSLKVEPCASPAPRCSENIWMGQQTLKQENATLFAA